MPAGGATLCISSSEIKRLRREFGDAVGICGFFLFGAAILFAEIVSEEEMRHFCIPSIG
jgi:hypothetical protein